MATYVNDLRLKEIATGDESGTWGASTNTNLELIAEAFSFGTEAITTNADTHTTTIADGSTDPGRSIFLKYTGTLDSACTITIGPNTVSKLWFIENATSGSQSIIVSQGSGANITIPNGQTKAIYSDGAGSGAAMVDAFQDLSIPDLFIDDDLTIGDDLVFSSDSAVITFGADGDTTLTHTDGSGLTLNSTNKLMFNDASQFIQGSSATVLSLGATDEIDLTATAIDINGTLDVSGTTAFGGAVTITETGSGSAAGPFLNLFRDSSSPADGDDIGIIQFRGDDDAGNATTYASVSASIHDASNTTEDGRFNLNTMVAGSSVSRMYMVPTATTFNDGGGDIDFRVESDGNTHMLFVDAGNDRVLVGKSSSGLANQGVEFEDGQIKGTATGQTVAFFNRASDDGTIADFRKDNSSVGILGTVDGDLNIHASASGHKGLRFGNGFIAPTSNSTTVEDATTDLGLSTHRFKDLHLSGSIVNSSDITLDAAGDIIFDADGGDFRFKDAGTQQFILDLDDSANSVILRSSTSDGDMIFQGNDGGSNITALTLDMSAAGRAIFGADADMADGQAFRFGDSQDLLIFHSSNENIIQANTTDQDLLFKGVDGGSSITALTLDMSAAGAATFNAGATFGGNVTLTGAGNTALQINTGNNSGDNSQIQFGDSADADVGQINYDHGTNAMQFRTNAGSNSIVIDSAGATTFSGNVKASDILASGSGGLSLQTDDGVKRIVLEDSGTITLGNNSLAAATTLNTRRTAATGDILRITGGNSNVSEFAAILLHATNVTGGTQEGIITFNTIDVAGVGDATLQEALRINHHQNLLVNGSADIDVSHIAILQDNAKNGISIKAQNTAAKMAMQFINSSGTRVGFIQYDSSNTTFSTSSDYRLKENITDLTSATDRLKQLTPKRFNFIGHADRTVDGFLAHEVSSIVPEAVTGEKDAMRDEEYEVTPAVRDDDGNLVKEAVMGTRSVPDYQGIDQSKLVPLLVATIKELEARIAALESQ